MKGTHFYRSLRMLTSILLLAIALTTATSYEAHALDQWAFEVIDFSSQYSSAGYAAKQTLGPSNVSAYGDNGAAWTASSQNGTQEYVTVGMAFPVYATGVTVRESWGNGFVTKIDVVAMDGSLHTVWTGTDPSVPSAVVDYRVNWTKTAYPVRGVRVHVNTSATNVWEEIDSIQLHGDLVGYPQWAARAKDFSSQWSLTSWSAAQVLGAPNVYDYSDNSNSWAASQRDGTQEFLQLDYDAPVYASGVLVRETLGNGFVTQIDIIDTANQPHTVWSGTDPTPRGEPGNFRVNFTQTTYLVKGVIVHINTSASTEWEEVDAVALFGVRPAGLSGTVVLEECVDMKAPATLEFRPKSGGSAIVRNTTLGSDGSFIVSVVPSGDYLVAVKASKWLRKVSSFNTTADPQGPFVTTLAGGDANGDNSIDVFDLDALIQGFDAAPGDANWNEGDADFNGDSSIDVLDLDILIRNFDKSGDD